MAGRRLEGKGESSAEQMGLEGYAVHAGLEEQHAVHAELDAAHAKVEKLQEQLEEAEALKEHVRILADEQAFELLQESAATQETLRQARIPGKSENSLS